jgi:hypothetical protein
MADALIGHTGFVGRNLMASRHWDAVFNRSNLSALAGAEFDLLVCAGLPAQKWLANRDPQADEANMLRLSRTLDSVRARHFVLISTIDVYPDPVNVDEFSAIEPGVNHAYGEHRRQFELRVSEQFEHCHILRLPAVFGPHLKKNVLFDLLNSNGLDSIQARSEFQWYPVTRLAHDIERSIESGLSCANLFTEPLQTQRILSAFFPDVRVGAHASHPVRYRAETRFGPVFGGDARFIMSADCVIESMRAWLDQRPVQPVPDQALAGV